MMAESSGTIALGALAGGGVFPREFRRGLFGGFDRRFATLLLLCGVIFFVTVGILSMRKPSEEITEADIQRIQERYARLVLNQPEVVLEPKVAEVAEQVTRQTEQVKKEEKKEEVKVDREKETFVERKQRRESGAEQRRQARELAAKQVQAAGLFAAITATGSGGRGGSSTSDLLGAAGLGVTSLGDMTLSKGTFATKNVEAADLVARKGAGTADIDIRKEQVGRTTVARVASTAEVTVTTQAPEVTGESASLSDRSQSAIQAIVNRESRRLKRLYEDWLKRDPTLGGRLTIKFVILPSGAVSSVAIVSSTTENGEFDETVVRYIRRWQFSEVAGAGPVEVVYPFVFEGQG